MKRLTIIGIALSLLFALALWQQKHIVTAKAAPMFATLTVTSTADGGGTCPDTTNCTLRDAIAAAASGDTITFDATVFATPRTITLTGVELLINKNLTITGPGAVQLAINGNAASRVFHIGPGITVTIAGLTITNGHPPLVGAPFEDNLGAGIYNDHSTLTVSDCTISGNSVHEQGGGIYNNGALGSSAALTIVNSTISGNSAQDYCGGIYNDGFKGSATLTIVNSTISGNSAGGGGASGGGIFSDGSGNSSGGGSATLTINSSTFSGNSGVNTIQNYGFSGSATVVIGNTILNAGPISSGGSGANIDNSAGTVTSLGYNLSSDGTGPNNGTTDQINTPPLLGPLQDNGGPTFTHALLCDSPAIDKGKNLNASATDQRGAGFARTFDDPAKAPATDGDDTDIGAFEAQTPVPPCNTDPTITGETISRQQGSPAPASPEHIATVDDTESGPSGVTVTVSSVNPSNGVTVSNIVNTNGIVTADVVAACGATNATFTLTATDGDGATATATLTVNVTPNTLPTLSYNGPVSVLLGGSTTVSPATVPSDNGSITGYAVQSVVPALTTAPTVNGSGFVSITNAAPIGNHTITIRATDNCGVFTDAQFTLVVNSAKPADLDIEKSDASDPVLLGSNITYKIEVENDGPGNATGVVVTDTLPAGVTFVAALSSPGCFESPSQTVTCTIGNLAKDKEAKRTIVGHPTVAGRFTNTARVTADQPDPKQSNNTDNESTTVAVGVASLTLSPTSVKGGSNVVVTGTVTLSGQAPSGGVVVTLSSSSTDVAKPAVNSITIPFNSSVGTFAVKHFKVSSTKTAKIKASANGFSKEATLTVTKN